MLAAGPSNSRAFHDESPEGDPLIHRSFADIQCGNGIPLHTDLEFRANVKPLAGPKAEPTIGDSAELDDSLASSAALASGVSLLVLAVMCHEDRRLIPV